MSNVKRTASGQEKFIGRARPIPTPLVLDAAAYDGALAVGDDGQLYLAFDGSWDQVATRQEVETIVAQEVQLVIPPASVEIFVGGQPGDFPDLLSALQHMARYNTARNSLAGPQVNQPWGRICIRSGHVLTQQINIINCDLSGVVIDSEDATVSVDCAGFQITEENTTRRTWLRGLGGTMPSIGTMFNFLNVGANNVIGVDARDTTLNFLRWNQPVNIADLPVGAPAQRIIGLTNPNTGVLANSGSTIGLAFADVTAVATGIIVGNNATLVLNGHVVRGGVRSIECNGGVIFGFGNKLIYNGFTGNRNDHRRTAGVDSADDLRVQRGGAARFQATTFLGGSNLSPNSANLEGQYLIAGGGSSINNTALNRMMQVTDFGLGASQPSNVTDIDALNIPVGFYRTVDTALGVFPTFSNGVAASKFGLLMVWNYTINNTVQIYVPTANGNGGGRMFYRISLVGSGWLPWRELFSNATILGAVSQSLGVPTGALRESGNNANGRFERDFSGSLECWRDTLSAPNATIAAGSRFGSADVKWTFPSAFLAGSTPVVTGMVVDADCDLRVVSVSNTQAVFRVMSDVSKAGALTILAQAKGRWSSMT